MKKATPTTEELQIAGWMHEEFERVGLLYQARVATEILQRFGRDHVYRNRNGNWAISAPILQEFRRLTVETAVWNRRGQFWRERRPADPPGKRMVRW